jgi:hypothetical protein
MTSVAKLLLQEIKKRWLTACPSAQVRLYTRANGEIMSLHWLNHVCYVRHRNQIPTVAAGESALLLLGCDGGIVELCYHDPQILPQVETWIAEQMASDRQIRGMDKLPAYPAEVSEVKKLASWDRWINNLAR